MIPTRQNSARTIAARHNPGEHPDWGRLKAFAADGLAQDERANVFQHVAGCAQCRSFLELIAPEEGPPTPVALSRGERRRY
jgi:hypothetical protein